MIDVTLADTMLRFAGRLHPVLVHFPIALFIAAAIFELGRLLRRSPEPSAAARGCVVLAAIGAAGAAFSGWMNADFESHAQSVAGTIFWHRWIGVAVAGLGIVVAMLAVGARYVKSPALHRAYATLLLATAAGVGLVGHFGGSLVYGDDYLWAVFREPASDAPGPAPAARTPALARPAPAGTVTTVDFARDIQPILTRNCIDCHGPDKQKGDLRLDHAGHLFARDTGEEIVVPGQPEGSEVVKRLSMKKGERGRMPPRGDPLPEDQVELVRRWIAEGAYWSEAAAVGGPSPAREGPGLLDSPAALTLAPPSDAPVAPASWSGEEATAIEAVRALGGRVEPVAAGSTELDINLSVAGAGVTDGVLAPVAMLGSRVRVLNLARTQVTDAGVSLLKACDKLEKLQLEGTKVTDAAMPVLAGLPGLSSLNVGGTSVTDEGIQALAGSKSLKNLYVADSKVTLDGAIRLQERLESLNIEVGIPK